MVAERRVRLPPVKVSFAYVLILEWLDDDDERTGEDLHRFLSTLGVRSELRRCVCDEDVKLAIAEATRDVNQKGKPVVHLETHGSAPHGHSSDLWTFGATATEGLQWATLGDWLAPLNEASDFQMLVVGAACFGQGVIGAMKVLDHPAPFAATLGFTTSIDPGSLRLSLQEFYRTLTTSQDPVLAVADAKRELRRADQNIELVSAIRLGLDVLNGVYDGIRTSEAMSDRVRGLLEKAQALGLPTPTEFRTQLPSLVREKTRTNLITAWNAWFPISLQERDASYVLNWDYIEAPPAD